MVADAKLELFDRNFTTLFVLRKLQARVVVVKKNRETLTITTVFQIKITNIKARSHR